MAAVLARVDVKHESVFWAVGNHDIKRGNLRSMVIREIRKSDSIMAFEDAMRDEETRALLTQVGMVDYTRQYNRIFNRTLSSEDVLAAHLFYGDLEYCNLIVLNTCLTSCDDEDNNKLMITESGLLRIFEKIQDREKPLIVLGHHGKEVFHHTEQKKLAHLFEEAGVDLYLCGHTHQLGYARFDDAERDIPQITCGGGTIGRDTIFTFIFGEYNHAKREVRITPYSYRGAGRFDKDFNLHRRLMESNNFFSLERLSKMSSKKQRPCVAEKDLVIKTEGVIIIKDEKIMEQPENNLAQSSNVSGGSVNVNYYHTPPESKTSEEDTIKWLSERVNCLESVLGEGKRQYKNCVFIDVDVPNNEYIIKVKKFFELIDLDFKWIMIMMPCNRYVGQEELEIEYYKKNPVSWNVENWDITLRVIGKENCTYQLKRTEYPQGSSNVAVVKVEYCSKEGIIIPLKLGDKVEFTYSFRISNKHWGSYISRQLSVFKEDIVVQLSNAFNKSDLTFVLDDKNGSISYLEEDVFVKENDDGIEIKLPSKERSSYQIDNYSYRIHWDANKIFFAEDLNSPILQQYSGTVRTIRKCT